MTDDIPVANFVDASGDVPVAQSVDGHFDEHRNANPYASPLTQDAPRHQLAEEGGPIGVWRIGNAFLLHQAAVLPARCILTNAPCEDAERRTLKLDSRNKLWLARGCISIVGGVFVYGCYFSDWKNNVAASAIALLLTLLVLWLLTARRPPEVSLDYSYSHKARNTQLIRRWGGGGMAVLSALQGLIAWAFLGNQIIVGASVFFGALLFIFGVLVFSICRLPLHIERSPGNYLLIRGCGAEYVANFPKPGEHAPFIKNLIRGGLR